MLILIIASIVLVVVWWGLYNLLSWLGSINFALDLLAITVLCFFIGASVGNYRAFKIARQEEKGRGLTILILGIACVATYYVWYQGSVIRGNAETTATAQFVQLSTATSAAQMTETADPVRITEAALQKNAQSTATAQFIQSSTATSAARMTAAAEPIKATEAALQKNAKRVYGPTKGELIHEDDDFLETRFASVTERNFIVESRFYNPYSDGKWDCGFLFRWTDRNEQYRLFVMSSGSWYLELITSSSRTTTPTPVFKQLSSGQILSLDVSSNGSNLLRLVVNSGEAIFFVNDLYVARLDVSAKLDSGDIFIAIGNIRGYETPGKVTRYEGFTIWSLP